VIVLLGALGTTTAMWEPQLAAFRDATAFDLPGHGSEPLPEGPVTVEGIGEQLLERLPGTFSFCGLSLGGMVGMWIAANAPERVERLVLACTTPGGASAFPLPEQTQRLMAEAPSLPQEVALERFVENALGPSAPRELIERIVVHRLAAPPDPVGWAAQAAAGASFDAFDRLERIAAPTLVLHGTADAVVDARNAELLGERIPSARVELFAGSGHLFFWEQPERFVEIVGEFLSC
jgi:3-oxoadipate enol-lactonase